MKNRIVITKYKDKIIVLFLKDDSLVKIRVIDDLLETTDSVFLGRVSTVKDNISSSFVRYHNGIGFIPNNKRKAESVFPVMLKKEMPGNKADELTDHISLVGIYTIVSDSINSVRFSSRTSNKYKNEFNTQGIKNVIIRNNAENTDYESVINEYKLLSYELSRINSISDKRTENSVLYKGIPRLIQYIFSENISEYDEILTDIDEAFEVISNYYTYYKSKNININIPVTKYEDKTLSLASLISISSKIDRAINRKVHLNCDAYIIIDHTEAMTVIDVNSGTTTFKGDKDSVIHNINLEACEEIAGQLKLRNLSGIIIVDLINEKNTDNYNELITCFKKLTKNDDCHVKCHGITKLGLMEITRERKEKSLREQLWK